MNLETAQTIALAELTRHRTCSQAVQKSVLLFIAATEGQRVTYRAIAAYAGVAVSSVFRVVHVLAGAGILTVDAAGQKHRFDGHIWKVHPERLRRCEEPVYVGTYEGEANRRRGANISATKLRQGRERIAAARVRAAPVVAAILAIGGVPERDLLGRCSRSWVVLCRQLLTYWLRHRVGLSWSEIMAITGQSRGGCVNSVVFYERKVAKGHAQLAHLRARMAALEPQESVA